MRKTQRAAAAAVLLAVFTGIAGCADSGVSNEIQLPIYGAEEIRYEIATAQYMDISQTDSYGATVGYPYAVYLSYPADAQLVAYNTVRGYDVAEGDVLAELDSSELDYEINNQQSVVNSAYQASLSGGRADQLQYQIEQMKLDMMLAEKDSYTIRAPFDGTITLSSPAAAGTSVQAGALCCAISEPDRFVIYIDGRDSSNFRYGQKVQVRLDETYYDAVVAEAPDIAPASAYGSSANRVVFDVGDEARAKILEESPMAVVAGWATIFATTEKKNVLAVPEAAVKSTGTQSYVTLVDGTERYKLKVTTGKSLGGYTEILDGISQGDVVICEGSGVYTPVSSEPTE